MMRHHPRGRRAGTVVVAVCVSLVGILGVVALTLDGGLVVDKRRQVQAAADAAALAAAAELFQSVFTNGGYDNGPLPNKTGPAAGEIAQFAKDVAKKNGFEDGVDGVTVEVFIPPQTGLFVGQKGHVEVRISTAQQRHFSTIFGSNADVPIGARAVARGTRTTINNGIIVLDPDNKGAFQTGGGGSSTVKGSASVIVNSSNVEAMIANGGGSVTSSTGFDVTGVPGWSTPGGGSFVGPIESGVEPTPDPLRFIPPPDPTKMVTRSTKRLNYSSATTLNMLPGLYVGGVSITGKANVNMSPGIYYFAGGFSFSGQGTLSGSEVMLYNDPKSTSDAISLTGGGSTGGAINLSPPTSGVYKGILIFQSRTSPYQPTVGVTGNGGHSLSISGTFYAPQAELKITGNGDQDTIGSQYISNTLTLGGNGTFNVDWDPNVVPGIRQVWLVE